ncbi:FAD-dependent oxidoreductase [Caballeronia sp. LZ001]|uniref:FAD-dependent oxidoreductase n=1 Tax=Caballeronia sp. LZ001 TaxID=3038553 RepID=UPI002857B219|nr:FAD-dependent oxidoreductase [Caballeronia sp. LZ001]MDR5804832.1 FAD-dependent oxidoreductase [Caballeronia sp. LZ001]
MTDPKISVALGPLRVSDAPDVRWDRETDVIVVGFGGAGACAALEAHEAGAEVLLVDRFDGGGATARSGGILYAGATAVQDRVGVPDSVEAMYRYLESELGDAVSPATLRRFCEGSRNDVDWLVRLGVPYSGELFSPKVPYPPASSSLFYSGNEAQFEQKTGTRASPRGHRPLGEGFTGRVFFDALKNAVERAKIPCLTHTLVSRLIIDATDAVIGVEARPIAPVDIERHRELFASVTPLKPLNPTAQDEAIDECRRLELSQQQVPVRIRARRGVILSPAVMSSTWRSCVKRSRCWG